RRRGRDATSISRHWLSIFANGRNGSVERSKPCPPPVSGDGGPPSSAQGRVAPLAYGYRYSHGCNGHVHRCTQWRHWSGAWLRDLDTRCHASAIDRRVRPQTSSAPPSERLA